MGIIYTRDCNMLMRDMLELIKEDTDGRIKQ